MTDCCPERGFSDVGKRQAEGFMVAGIAMGSCPRRDPAALKLADLSVNKVFLDREALDLQDGPGRYHARNRTGEAGHD
jgi:hypothetical protein